MSCALDTMGRCLQIYVQSDVRYIALDPVRYHTKHLTFGFMVANFSQQLRHLLVPTRSNATN